ncbi:hypothetical protein G7054_g4168 [Neopestalotiopsis clavispora]|nr:hypothetical protein G7054_g4168 [Neopestalotiopsis clavispora]
MISSSEGSAAPLGLVQVWPKDDRTTTIDIVAIHGLDSRSERTYMAFETEGDTSSRRIHWLRDSDMLPSYVEDARIFTYDWRSNTYDGASVQHFHTYALALLGQLSRNRRGPSAILTIPFHPKAFTMAAGLEEFADVYQSICGFIFIGTPFRGGQGTTFFRRYVQISHLLGKVASYDLTDLVGIRKDDGRLDEIRTQFCEHALQKWGARARERVCCFYETDPTMILRAWLPRWAQTDRMEQVFRALAGDKVNFLFVSPDSACLDTFGREALNVRHAMTNKFRNREDHNLRTIVSHIGDMIGRPEILNGPQTTVKPTAEQQALLMIAIERSFAKGIETKNIGITQARWSRDTVSSTSDYRRHTILV